MSTDPNYRVDAAMELQSQRLPCARVPGVTGAGSGWAALPGLDGPDAVLDSCWWACPASGT